MKTLKLKTPKVPKYAPATAEMDALNAVIPGMGDHYENKTVVIGRRFFGETAYGLGDRRFFATGGFGCDPTKSGSAVFGYFLVDGENARVERGDVTGIAVNEATPEEHKRGKDWNQTHYS